MILVRIYGRENELIKQLNKIPKCKIVDYTIKKTNDESYIDVNLFISG